MLDNKGTAVKGRFTPAKAVWTPLMLNNNIVRAVMFEEQVLCITQEVDRVIIYNNSTHPEMLNT